MAECGVNLEIDVLETLKEIKNQTQNELKKYQFSSLNINIEVKKAYCYTPFE